MKPKSKDLQKPVPAKSVSLGRVLNQSKKIKKTVKQAATDLTSVNEVLKQGETARTTPQTIQQAVTQNKNVEHKVARAADDLTHVNAELARELAERVVIESELAETKSELAEALDDLSQSQANEEEARQIALLDALTGLPNRMLFDQRFEQGLSQAKRHGWGLAILFIDIDKFKDINDTYGHDMGDRVLQMVANRLQSFVRAEDTVSRWGGDEFVCLLLEVKQEASLIRLAEKMVNRLADPGEFDGAVISIKASIGIAVYPVDGETAEILFKNADSAMYKAKASEKSVMLFRESALD